MSIHTRVVHNPRIYGVYQVSDDVLGIGRFYNQHDVVILSINRSRRTAKVKTITSLERDLNGRKIFKNRKLDDCKRGVITPIPINELNSNVYSGVHHNFKIVPLNRIHYKNDNDNTIIPNRYKHLIK